LQVIYCEYNMIKRVLRSHSAELSRTRGILFKSIFETIIQTNEHYDDIQELHEIVIESLKSIDEFKDFPFLFLFDEIESKEIKRQYLALRCLGDFSTIPQNFSTIPWGKIFKRLEEFKEWLVQKLINVDWVSRLIYFLRKDLFPHLQIEITKILEFIFFTGTIKQCKTIIDFAIIPIFQLLNSKNFEVVESVKFYFSF